MRILFTFIFLMSLMLVADSQTVTGSFSHGGQTRSYSVYLPVNFNSSAHLPLVINMHGKGSTGSQQQLYTGMDAIADTGRFVVAYPNAVTYQGEVQWNSFGLASTPDDVGFISALIDTLYRRYNIDLSRVYATGLSSGGFMSYKLACALSCRIAAIAPVAGLLIDHPLAPCNLSKPVALFHIHGTNDATVPYTGLGTYGVYSVHGSITAWRSKLGGCPGSPTVTNLPDINTSDNSTVVDTTYGPCNSSTEITLYAVTNGGHTWPGAVVNLPGLVTNRDFNASNEIWLFVKRYSISAANLSITGLASSYCSSASAVTMTGTPSGGTFSGTGVSGSTFTPSSVTAGTTVTVTYTRASGSCTYYVSQNVTVSSGVTASISPATVTICGGSTTLTASGGTSYSWSTGATTAAITVSPASTTTYTVTATSGGCTGTASRTVTVTSGLTATISPSSPVICSGASVTLTASGGTNYSWNNGSASSSITVNPASTTSYTVTVTDAAGSCSATASKTVTVNANPIASISPTSVSFCNGASATLTASGGTTYSWSTSATTSSINVSPSFSTSYTVTVTNANGCTGSASKTVTVNPNPTASISPATVTICSGSVTLTASGGTSYLWSNSSTATTITVSPLSTTTYSVTATDANGCTGTTSRTVNVATSLTGSISPATASICEGENIILTASGGTNYSWNNSSTSAAITVSPSSSTTYSVTVTDGSGSCSATTSKTVTVNPLPTATATSNPASIVQGNSSTITGSGGVSYQWSTGQTTPTFTVTPDSTTTFSITVTDDNGCTASAQTTVTVLPNGVVPIEPLPLKIYPNPSSGILNIEVETRPNSLVTTEIFTSSGKKLVTLSSTTACNVFCKISYSELKVPEGIYHVRITAGGKSTVKKLVVMKSGE